MPDPSIYNVGWICAIKPEYVAAQAFLDEKHERPDHVSTNDSNIYTLGRFGKHNVVIGTLPDGEYGIAAAVGVAKGMLSSFPNVRIGLMVGIGGGALSSKNDIRLGDIVVSAPRNGHGGVFQYDFGDTIQDKKFQTVGLLNQPPELIRAALTDIQAEYDMEGHQLEEVIDTALSQRPRLRKHYQRPSDSSDKLFKSGLVHRGIDGGDCATDCYDGPSSIVERQKRTSEEDNPVIHYGTIASANQLMKDALVRDRLAAEENVLCFEMEAAGLMNRFPCIVIRGICDYADSHKNKQWQGYAAMAAAAYAKDLLRRIPVTKLEAERQISVVLGSIDTNIKRIQSTATQLQSEIQGLHDSVLNARQKSVLDRLHVAEGASFDSSAQEHNRYCLPNTRVALLQQISEWAKDLRAEPIFWLNGMAGTGKSTISRTVARSLADNGQLGASFFFKKGETDRGSLSKFFMTVAADLIARKPSIAHHIEAVLNADHSITSKNYTEQFQKFLLEPLTECDIGNRPIVLVVDALDECEQEDDIKRFLYLVSRLETELPDRIRIFLTSRPEEPFRSQFQKVKRTNSRVILHEIPKPVVEHDIDVFLRYELSSIRAEFNSRVPLERHLTVAWPSQASFDGLLKMTVPLFIAAATICRFISDRKVGIPTKLLERVLSQSSDGLPQLEITYGSVLDNLTAGVSPSQQRQIIQDFRQVVGSIILLASPLSTSSLAVLLSMAKDDIDSRLDLLHSVLSIPASAQAPVRLLHLSFRDFLLHPEEPMMPFRVNEKQTHANLAAHCLRILGCLQKDLCNIEFPGTPRSDVSIETINSALPPELQYACLHWVYHLEKANTHLSDDADAYAFLTKHFLHWLEALALMGRASDSICFLRTLQSQAKDNSSRETSLFLEDATRFVQAYMSTISSTPLQLYSSLLIFTPNQSKIRTIFEHSNDAAEWIWPKPQIEESWNSCLQILEGHNSSVESVAFSHDSALVAVGCYDYTVRIWRANTGERLQTLAGHSDPVWSVAFSHDSALLASGSDDSTRIWRADTGECIQTLAHHSGRVRSKAFAILSVAFSHDSALLASGCYDSTIRIWRAGTGKCMQTLAGHSGMVLSVAFSHNSTLLASGSSDSTVRIWRSSIGKCMQTLAGHSSEVQSVAFSHDSALVLSGSLDSTVRIWRASTGECMQTLAGHGRVVSMAFSHDSALVASGYYNSTVRIWRTSTGECLQTLAGHSRSVKSVAFSHDSALVASGSDDSTVRIWRAGTSQYIQTLAGHSVRVQSVAISHDSALVASGCYNSTVRIWRAGTGECLQTLAVHSGAAQSVAISHDSTLVASGCCDFIVRIWHTSTGECVQTLAGHSDVVLSVAFSHDSALIASGSYDCTVRIWRAGTGECVQTLAGHGLPVETVVFAHDSALVASGSRDATVRVWRADTGECVQTLAGHRGWVQSVALSHDSALVAAGSYDVRIWRADTGECIQTVDIGFTSQRLLFRRNSSYLTTDVGTITINGGTVGDRNMLPQWSGIGISKDWITWDGRNLLWLPVDFRPSCSAVSESIIAIGSSSGRVTILGISPDSFMSCWRPLKRLRRI
ncbi:vegetative incompatibility protein HET-E-1 [Cordyceps javanica]|nr:vegetative incompatibility protein HET-E-1 [Cordyceps javanica]